MVIYGLQRISSSPHVRRAKSIVSDSLLIPNRRYMNPPPQEAYLYIFPARFHQCASKLAGWVI